MEKLIPSPNLAKQWHTELIRVRNFSDAMGMGVDKGIEQLVVALRLSGFETYLSCEGHIDRPSGGPYVLMLTPDADGDYRANMKDPAPKSESDQRKTLEEIAARNLRTAALLVRLVESFYRAHLAQPDALLIVRPIGYSAFRLGFAHDDFLTLATPHKRATILHLRQDLLQRLADHLRAQFDEAESDLPKAA